jgi:GDP-L-fucose synthase
MNTLVTGGSGLVGSAIESKFKPGRARLDLMNIDDIIRYISLNKIDSIIHCAARVGGIKENKEKPADFFYENSMMTMNLIEASRVCNVKKIVCLLSTCIFPHEADYPLTIGQMHNGEPHPSNYGYGFAKRMTEINARAYREQHEMNIVTVVPCNIYGPNDNFNMNSGHVIAGLIHKCYLAKQNNTNFEIWGTGKPYREFLYSKDIGHIAQWVLENYNETEPLIVSPDEEINIAVLAQQIAWRIGFEGNIVYNQELDGMFRKPSDNSKFKSLLPDYKFVPIELGLEETIKWFIENYDNENIRL